MKKNFFLILSLFILLISFFQKDSCAEEKIERNTEQIIKNTVTGAVIGFSAYFLTTIGRKTFKEWTKTKTVLENCKTIFNLNNLSIIKNDLAYACASGAYLTLSTDQKTKGLGATQNALLSWGLISLSKAITNTKNFNIDSFMIILSKGVCVSKIKPDSFSNSAKERTASTTSSESTIAAQNSKFKTFISKLPLQKYKKIYLTIVFWCLWKLYKENKICISFSQKNFFELCAFYKYGLLTDCIVNGANLTLALEFLISHYIPYLEENSYQLEYFFRDFGIMEGIASGITKFF